MFAWCFDIEFILFQKRDKRMKRLEVVIDP